MACCPGLFIGIEFVRRDTQDPLEPAAAETSWVCSQLKDRYRILTSVDGPHHNVIVVKPPMVFDEGNVDTVMAGLTACLTDLEKVDLTTVSHTPT